MTALAALLLAALASWAARLRYDSTRCDRPLRERA